MAIAWGSSVNGAWKLGHEFSQVPVNASILHNTVTVEVTLKLYIWTKYNTTDSSNTFAVSGTGTLDYSGAVSISTPSGSAWSTSNQQLIKTLVTTVTLNYGSSQIVSFSASLTGIDYPNPSYVETLSGSWTVNARPYGVPAAPTDCTVTRVSDTQQTVAWTNHNNDPDSGHPYTNLVVERWDNVTAVWAVIATLGVVTSYSNTTTVANRRYQYRVKATNSAGSSGYSTSGYIATTPDATSTPVATKAVTDIDLSWSINATYPTSIEIWHAADDVWDGSALATLAASATSYTHVAPSASATHKYKVRIYADTLYADSAESNTIQLLTNPLAPTNLTPSGTYLDATEGFSFTWQHNPVDNTAQTAYELQYREVGAGSWTNTGKVVSASSAMAIVGGTLANNKQYEWQVRTWGQYATEPSYSPWSSIAVFNTSARPTATINTPTDGGTVTSNRLTVEWGYYDAESSVQAGYRCKIYDSSDNLLASYEGTGTGTSHTFSTYNLADLGPYKIGVQVRDAVGLWSLEDVHSFSVDYLKPVRPTIVATWDGTNGTVTIEITNPTPDTEPDVIYNELWRKIDSGEWILVQSDIAPNSTVTDYIPAIDHDNTYKAVAYSALPSSIESAESVLSVVDSGRWLWLNGGPGFSLISKVRGNPAIDISFGRKKTLYHFAGREKPIEFTGESRTRTLSLKATLEPTIDVLSVEELEIVTDYGGVVCYRDSVGRRLFVSMGEIKVLQEYPVWEFNTDITEVDYSE